MARVLVTRALPEALTTAERVRAAGHAALVSPTLCIENLAASVDIGAAQALLFTSAAGVRALAHRRPLLDTRVIAVGDATAQAARAARFTNVVSADGAGADLVALVRTALMPEGGAIIHVRGQDAALDVAGELRSSGYAVSDAVVYRAVWAAALTEEALEGLRADPPQIDSVLFHSARGAQGFVRLLRAAHLAHKTVGLQALCMSERVAGEAKALTWRDIRAAFRPREEALLSLL